MTLAAASAMAAPGVVMYGTQIFAGPSPDYPAVGAFAPGTPVEVFGCEQGWGWCDIASGPYRGWAPGNQIEIAYQGMQGPLYSYGPQIGLPIIGFSFGEYWGAHYRSQPWFSDHDRWGGGYRGPEGHFGGPPMQMHGGYGGPGPGRPEEWHGGGMGGRPDDHRQGAPWGGAPGGMPHGGGMPMDHMPQHEDRPPGGGEHFGPGPGGGPHGGYPGGGEDHHEHGPH